VAITPPAQYDALELVASLEDLVGATVLAKKAGWGVGKRAPVEFLQAPDAAEVPQLTEAMDPATPQKAPTWTAAMGDGTAATDARSAIQWCLDENTAKGRPVVFPRGRYRIASSCTLLSQESNRSGQGVVQGVSPDGSVLIPDVGVNAIRIEGAPVVGQSAPFSAGFNFANFSIRHASTPGTGKGIFADTATRPTRGSLTNMVVISHGAAVELPLSSRCVVTGGTYKSAVDHAFVTGGEQPDRFDSVEITGAGPGKAGWRVLRDAVLINCVGPGAGGWAVYAGARAAVTGTGRAVSTTTDVLIALADVVADDEYNGLQYRITAGRGNGGRSWITDSVDSTNALTLSPALGTNPDATSVYAIEDGYINIDVNSSILAIGCAFGGFTEEAVRFARGHKYLELGCVFTRSVAHRALRAFQGGLVSATNAALIVAPTYAGAGARAATSDNLMFQTLPNIVGILLQNEAGAANNYLNVKTAAIVHVNGFGRNVYLPELSTNVPTAGSGQLYRIGTAVHTNNPP
jgi:hypothetical protein